MHIRLVFPFHTSQCLNYACTLGMFWFIDHSVVLPSCHTRFPVLDIVGIFESMRLYNLCSQLHYGVSVIMLNIAFLAFQLHFICVF